MKDYNGFSATVRNRANTFIKAGIKSGTIPAPVKCCACGQEHGIIDYHAESYAEPFGPHVYEYPLCFRCHMMVHCRFNNPQSWELFKQDLREGKLFKPVFFRNFGIIKAHLVTPPVEYAMDDPRPVLIFDKMGI